MTENNENLIPVQRSHYGKLEYWEKRYSENNKPFEWYQNFDGIKDIVTQYINPNSKILNVGCGNSCTLTHSSILQYLDLSEDMFKEGYQYITNIDFSKLVIASQQEKYKDYPNHFQFTFADVRDLPFENESFDCIIDKGTFDCVLAGEYSKQNSKKMLNHIYRALNSKGVYILITYGQPENRINYLKKVILIKPQIFFQSIILIGQQQLTKFINLMLSQIVQHQISMIQQLITTFMFAREQVIIQILLIKKSVMQIQPGMQNFPMQQ